MGAEHSLQGRDPTNDVLSISHYPIGSTTNCHAVTAYQAATTGNGTAINATSNNADTAAAIIRGAGNLLDLRDSTNTSRFTIGQTGAITTGDVIGTIRAAYKTADEEIASSTVLQDDNHLLMSVAANGIYALDMYLDVEADPAADISFGFTAPAGAAMSWTEAGVSAGTANNIGSIKMNRLTLASSSSVGIIAAGTAVMPRGVLRVGGTAGTLTFQWAQLVSSGTATIVKLGSWLRLHRIA